MTWEGVKDGSSQSLGKVWGGVLEGNRRETVRDELGRDYITEGMGKDDVIGMDEWELMIYYACKEGRDVWEENSQRHFLNLNNIISGQIILHQYQLNKCLMKTLIDSQ